MSKRKARDADVEMGTGNVYADLRYDDADEMLIKAQLVAKIAEIIKRKCITQAQAGIAGSSRPIVLATLAVHDFPGSR